MTKLARVWTEEDIDLIEQFYIQEARQSFWAYRQFMDTALVKGWWPRDVSIQLQLFFQKLIRGERPQLVIMAPPQHGKSRGLHDFISWVAGHAPDLRVIYGSFSNDLGITANRYLQRTYDSLRYQKIFPRTRIGSSNAVTVTTRALRNSSFIEYVDHKGYFRNVTVEGQINGKSLDLGVIDDPIKGREVAMSKLQRDKTWMWFTDDFFSRFSDKAGLIITMTRWHVDDPCGRFIEMFPDAIVLEYPAIATEDGEFRKKGEALFPEFKTLDFLMKRKELYTQASWESLYQQNPIVVGGGMFKIEKLKYMDRRPQNDEIQRAVRYWDKAGTSGGGAYTAGSLLYQLKNGQTVVADVVRGQWSAFDRETMIKSTAERDAALHERVEIWTEQEPGSGGKESAERTVANLQGHIVYTDRVTGKKELRAEPFASQVEAGNVHILAGDWNRPFLDELEMFPASKYKDQVDSASGAFSKTISKKYRYDATLDWVGEIGNRR